MYIIEPAALPAVRCTRRPRGGEGRCDGIQFAGCATVTVRLNNDSRNARGEAVTVHRFWLCAVHDTGHVTPALSSDFHQIRGGAILRMDYNPLLRGSWSGKRANTSLSLWIILRSDDLDVFRQRCSERSAAMALDENTRTQLEAAAFRRLLEHLRSHTEVQNIDMMNLAGFCRNCLSNWMKEAADSRGIPMTKDESREAVYGMPFDEWKAKYQKEATPEQKATFEKASHKH